MLVADLGCHATLSRSMALRIVIIFRMTATITTFGFLLAAARRLWKGFEGGIVSGCTEGGHVKDVTDRYATTVDAAMSFELAAVEVVRGKADKGSDLFAAH